MATSQGLSSSSIDPEGSSVATESSSVLSGFMMPSSATTVSIHASTNFYLAIRPNAKKHVPQAPRHLKAYIMKNKEDYVYHFAWVPPDRGCNCEEHDQETLPSYSGYYALEYQMQQIEINVEDSHVTVKNVYFGPLNKCAVTLYDNNKEYLFRVRCTNDGQHFGPYGRVYPITFAYNDFPNDEDDEGTKRKASASCSLTKREASTSSSLAQIAREETSYMTWAISKISTNPFVCCRKDLVFTLADDYTPNPKLLKECPKAIFASIDDSAIDRSSEAEHDDPIIPTEAEHDDPIIPTEAEHDDPIIPTEAEHDDPIIPTEAEETLKEIDDPQIQSILDDANKQQEKCTESSIRDLPRKDILPDPSEQKIQQATVSTLAAHSWPPFASYDEFSTYYDAYHSTVAKTLEKKLSSVLGLRE